MAPVTRGASESLSGSETVLLVEDETSLRDIVCQSLEASGYRVLSAASGAEALALNRAESRVDLLITDVVMPGMGGRRVAEVIRATRPHLRVVYMSGYTDSSIVDHGLLEPGVTFVQKPFTTDTLLRKIREVLDAPEKR